MADSNDDRAVTRGDLTQLALTLARASTEQTARVGAEQAAALAGARADLAEEAVRTRQALRGDITQLRHDVTSRLDTALAHLDALVEDRNTRLLAVVFLTQILLGVALALLHDLLT